MLGRREFLLAGGAALAAAYPAQAQTLRGMREIAAGRGLLFGSMVRGDVLAKDRAYADMMARECNLFVSREVHFDYLQPKRGTFDFAAVDTELNWAAAHQMGFRGACLLWGEHVPAWFTQIGSRDDAVRAVTDHITRVCRHYAGKVQSWDVVNEGIKLEDKHPGGLRKTVLLDLIGPDYMDIAFRAAREADPKARLVYNDFGMEYDLSWQLDKRKALLTMLDGFKKRGVPIDVVGLQSHLTTDRFGKFNDRSFADFLKAIADRGLDVYLSELDVYDPDAPADIHRRDQQVAGIYRHYLDVALASKAVKAVISWGLTDKDNWVTSPNNLGNGRRTDGVPSRPLPFDTDYIPKPAYVAIAEAISAAAPR